MRPRFYLQRRQGKGIIKGVYSLDNSNGKISGLRFDIEEEGGLVFYGDDTSREIKAPKTEEFSLPDTFEVNEKYNTPVQPEEPVIPVKRTYVPRFTSASENYRIIGNQTSTVAVKKTEEPELCEPKLDATAEIEAKSDIKPVVVISTPDRPDAFSDESIKIYKFESEQGFAAASDADEVFAKAALPVNEPRPEAVPAENEPAPEPIEPIEAAQGVEEDYIPKKTNLYDFYEEAGPDTGIYGKPQTSEFNSQAQRDSIKDKFLDGIMSVKIRFISVVLITLAMLIIEMLGYFGNFAFEYIGILHNGKAVIDLLFATSVLALAIPELTRAFGYIKSRVVCPELVLPVSYLLLAGYTLTVSLDNTLGAEYMSFSVLFAVQVLCTVAASYFRLKAEFKSFRVISRNAVKDVIDQRYTRTLERENMALDGVIDEYSSKIARIFRTAFVADFRYRSNKIAENSFNVLLILGISLGLGVVAGVVSFLITGPGDARFMVGYQALLSVFMLSVPAFSILSHKLVFKHSLDEAASEGSTFIGEGAVYESAETDVIAYTDTEIFGTEDVTIRKVHLYGKVYNTPKAMRQMYALFSAVGGPLEYVFAASLDRKCASADEVFVEDDGITGIFEGHRIMAGTEEYMHRNNVIIPEDDFKTKTLATDSTKVMYGAEDGEVYVKFFIRYSFSEEFTMLLPDLKSRKIIPLIYSSDPNITCELLRVLTLGEDNIRVMRTYRTKCGEKVYRRVSSGAVTLADKTAAVNLLLLARRYTSFQSSFAVSELISMMVGAALAVVLSLAFVSNISIIPGFALSVWQLAWVGVLYVRSKMTFRIKKDR